MDDLGPPPCQESPHIVVYGIEFSTKKYMENGTSAEIIQVIYLLNSQRPNLTGQFIKQIMQIQWF